MQAYILRLQACREEDLLVTLLTPKHIKTAYRFYGARHSTINLGYKIDAELQSLARSNLPQLRNVLHLANKWQFQRDKMLLWQHFINLFYEHLKGLEDIDEFYFDLLDTVAVKMEKQNPKRLQVEAYLSLLDYEGRLHTEPKCFLCEQDISDEIALARAFLPAHPKCIFSEPMPKKDIDELFESRSTILLDNSLVERLWQVMLEGF